MIIPDYLTTKGAKDRKKESFPAKAQSLRKDFSVGVEMTKSCFLPGTICKRVLCDFPGAVNVNSARFLFFVSFVALGDLSVWCY